LKGILSSTVLFGLIWAATNYMYSRALMTISATDVTALFSSAPAFVFVFSICILKEPPLILRVRIIFCCCCCCIVFTGVSAKFLFLLFQLSSVVLVISGIILFAYADGFQPASIIGVILSVGAAIGAAIYKVHNMHVMLFH